MRTKSRCFGSPDDEDLVKLLDILRLFWLDGHLHTIIEGREGLTYPRFEHVEDVAIDEAPFVNWGDVEFRLVQSLGDLSLDIFGFPGRRPLAADREGDMHVALSEMRGHPV